MIDYDPQCSRETFESEQREYIVRTEPYRTTMMNHEEHHQLLRLTLIVNEQVISSKPIFDEPQHSSRFRGRVHFGVAVPRGHFEPESLRILNEYGISGL